MPRSYRVRAATEGDLPGVRRCLRAAFEVYRAAYTRAAFRDTVLDAGSAKRRFQEMRILVAVDRAGAVVGTIAWRRTSPTEAHLRGMAVVPAQQGTGVAQSLLDRVLADLVRAGVRRVTLNTTPPLRRAARFYRRNGFRRSGRTADFFGMVLTGYVRALGRRRRLPTSVRSGEEAPRRTGGRSARGSRSDNLI